MHFPYYRENILQNLQITSQVYCPSILWSGHRCSVDGAQMLSGWLHGDSWKPAIYCVCTHTSRGCTHMYTHTSRGCTHVHVHTQVLTTLKHTHQVTTNVLYTAHRDCHVYTVAGDLYTGATIRPLWRRNCFISHRDGWTASCLLMGYSSITGSFL